MVAWSELHMNGGIGETSYANNSSVQRRAILMAKPVIEKAITELYATIVPKRINIADLGCSSGPNALVVSSEIIGALGNYCRKLGHESPEVQIFLNDLHGNDFNTLFKYVTWFQENLRKWRKGSSSGCYLTAAPGSFYDRLFPTESLHFVHSSYSVHWLSQVPEGLGSNNKGNIYIASTSPRCVVEAYYNQFRRDFSTFLKHRSVELVAGGRMVLTMRGRRSEDHFSSESGLVWALMAEALCDMVTEGLIEKERVESFNIPHYAPSESEISSLIKENGSFTIEHLETSETYMDASVNESSDYDEEAIEEDDGSVLMKTMRSVSEPLLLAHHFHEGLVIEEIYKRYQRNIGNCRSREKGLFVNVVVSMRKRTNQVI